MKKEKKFTKKLMFWFFIGTIAIFLISLSFLLYFVFTAVKEDFSSYTSISALILAFVSCISTAFFSLATYINGRNADRNYEDAKTNQYIIENYSLVNFCTEVTIVGQETESNIVLSDHQTNKGVSTNLCFLVSKYDNKPIYKILFKEIKFVDKKDKRFFSSEGIDGKYQEDTLNRKYNCVAVNIPLNIKDAKKLFYKNAKIEIELDVISIFNVQFTVKYEITIGGEKENINQNPDKKDFPDLETYILHHSIYRVEKQEIIEK
jgi:hypothetical protein